MENKDKTIEHEDSEPSTGVKNTVSTYQEAQEETIMNPKGIDGNEPTEGSNLLNSGEKMQQEATPEPNYFLKNKTDICLPTTWLTGQHSNKWYVHGKDEFRPRG